MQADVLGGHMKKVLIINTVLFGYNGITRVITNYYENMPKENLDIHIVACNKKELKIPDDIKKQLSGAKIYELSYRKKELFKYVCQLNKIMRKNKYDVVHIHGNSNTMAIELVLAFINKINSRIIHCHSSSCKHKITNKILHPVTFALKTNALACSKSAGDFLFKGEDYIVLKNSISVKDFYFNEEEREAYRKKFNIDENFVVGHIGLINKPKNQTFLVDIFNEIHKNINGSKLMLVSGSEKVPDYLQQKINELGLEKNILFLSKRSDVNKLIQAMDIFIFPSIYEGLGICLIEAQCSSLPCLVSDAVPEEVKVSQLVEFMSLNKSSGEWAEKAIEMQKRSDRNNVDVTDKIKEAGYSIEDNAKILYDIYNGE